MNDSIRIVVVDDHNLVRSGFRLLLESSADFQVVGDANDGESALELIAVELPDVVITDVAMKEMNGIELTRKVRAGWPNIQCIVLSMYKTSQYVKSAIDAGAMGYLLKDSVDAELELAIRAVMRGEPYFSPAVSRVALGDPSKPGVELTPRQTQVLRQIADGFNTKQIALNLGLSPKTVENHRAELMKRLQIFDVASLVRYAIREGFSQLD